MRAIKYNFGENKMKAKYLKGTLSILLTVVISMIIAVPVSAVPPLPSSFFGSVTRTDTGGPAPVGLSVIAMVDGQSAGETATFSFAGETVYRLDAFGDDPDTAAKEGGVSGEEIVLIVDGQSAGSGTWQSGTNTRLDFTWSPPDGGGGESGGGGLQVNLSDLSGSLQVDSQGYTISSVELNSSDGRLSFSIASNTRMLDSRGIRLRSITMAEPAASPPEPPPFNAIVLAYDLGPEGATFDPPITLTLSYDPAELPEGAVENNLAIAYWDGSQWEFLETTVNAGENSVSAEVSHFSTFALLAQIPPLLSITSPREGATLEPGNITLTIAVNYFNLMAPGGDPVSGEGHIHYYLDVDIPTTPGQPAVTEPGTYKATPDTSVTWENVALGEHTFGVQLVNNNHTPLDPPVTAAVMVTVKSPAEQLRLPTKEGIGQYLTGSSGMTLYYFTRDVLGQSNCTGQCVDFWPLFQAEEVIAPPGLDAADFSTINRDDGQKQATYKGWPLYYYANDVAPGDANGEGSQGVWYVIKEPFYNVMTMTNEALGNYLADAEGMTLYLFANDNANQSNWTGASWPTFYNEDIIATSNLNPADFGTITRDDGDKQTTYKGWPLYYFANDTAPGDTSGEGVGGVWFTLKGGLEAAPQAPALVPAPAPTPAPAPVPPPAPSPEAPSEGTNWGLIGGLIVAAIVIAIAAILWRKRRTALE